MPAFHEFERLFPKEPLLGPSALETHPRILAVLAHPDDESFGMGGTLAFYAWSGAQVFLVCATNGDLGEVAPEFLHGYASVVERRKAELCKAAESLGLAGVYMLGYRDSGMPGSPANQHPQALAAAPLDEVAARVTQYIRLLRPHVVLTFDPIGGYRHPDHIVAHHATVKAFHAAADSQVYPSDLAPYQPQKLYFHLISRTFLRLGVFLLRLFGKDPKRFGRNGDINLAALAKEDFPVHAQISYRLVEKQRKAAALAHASQMSGPGVAGGVFERILRFFGSKDQFMRAYPAPEPGLHESDLLADVRI